MFEPSEHLIVPEVLAERFPVVDRALEESERRWRERLALVGTLSPREFAEARDRLRVRMADDRRRPPEERGGAHRVLTAHELVILHAQIEIDERAGRLIVLDRAIAEPSPYIGLRALRANFLTGTDAVSGERFRTMTQAIAMRFCRQFRSDAPLPPELQPFGIINAQTVLALPWRAAIVPGEVFYWYGMRGILHLGIRRNEHTADPEVYAEEYVGSEPSADMAGLVVEPMCATGQTPATAIERLMVLGIPLERIVLFTYIAAPEGVDFLLRTYPLLRIVTVALDERLNERAYIEPGLGDFGDLVMRGIDDAYAEERWIRTGFLRRDQVDRIFTRTREVVEASQ